MEQLLSCAQLSLSTVAMPGNWLALKGITLPFCLQIPSSSRSTLMVVLPPFKQNSLSPELFSLALILFPGKNRTVCFLSLHHCSMDRTLEDLGSVWHELPSPPLSFELFSSFKAQFKWLSEQINTNCTSQCAFTFLCLPMS